MVIYYVHHIGMRNLILQKLSVGDKWQLMQQVNILGEGLPETYKRK